MPEALWNIVIETHAQTFGYNMASKVL